MAGGATVAPPPSLPSAAAASDAAAAVAALLPSSHAAPWPLEPTPLDVTPADRELLAAQFADAGETLYCIACVYKLVGERQKQSRARPLAAAPAAAHRAAAVRGPDAPSTLVRHRGGDGRLPTPKPAASIAEVRALAAALCCCGGVHGMQAIDVRLGEEAIMAFAEVLRFSTDMNALRLNHVTSNSNAARASMAALVDMLPNSRAPLHTTRPPHNAQLEESTLLR